MESKKTARQASFSQVEVLQDKELLIEGLTNELVLAQKIYQKDLEIQKKTHIDLFQNTIDELRSKVLMLQTEKQGLM